MPKKPTDIELEASLYRSGWLRLSMGAAYALGQERVDAEYFDRPRAHEDLLSVSLEWDRENKRLTVRGGEGPLKLKVYSRRWFPEGGSPRSIRPLFMILTPSKFRRASKGLWVPSTHRFPLQKVAEATLILDRSAGGLKVKHRRRRRPNRPKRTYLQNLKGQAALTTHENSKERG